MSFSFYAFTLWKAVIPKTKSENGIRQLFHSKQKGSWKLKFIILKCNHKVKCLHMLLYEIPTVTIVLETQQKLMLF